MIVDLHAHYPMHLSAASTLARMTDHHRSGWGDRIRALVLALANRVANYPRRVSRRHMLNLKAGDVGVILSVLYQPFDEIDLNQPYGAPPWGTTSRTWSPDRGVERDIATRFSTDAMVVKNAALLQAAATEHKVALIHAVEGGFTWATRPSACVPTCAASRTWRRVCDARAPVLARRGDQCSGAAVPAGLALRAAVPAAIPGPVGPGEGAVDALVEQHILIDVTQYEPARAE